MNEINWKGIFAAVIFLCLIVLMAMGNPIAIVGVGERGVKVTLGKTSPESFTEGVHFVTPFISKMHKMDVKTQKSNVATIVFTKDIQQARLEYIVNYNLQPDSVHKMFREVGTDYVSKIVTPVVEGTVKNVVGEWNASDLISNRSKATTTILSQLKEQLSDNYINVTDFQITNIDYSDSFEKAIEAKVTAEQEALQAKNQTVKVQEEAKQKILTAEAEAKSIQLKAQALANNRQLVELEYAKKWDGKLPQYVLGNSIPLINMGQVK